MSEIISVVSGKGGTGKSTIAAAIAKRIAKAEKRVLAVDMDIGLRSLDMFFNLQDKVVFDIGDVLDGKCSAEDAIVQHQKLQNLFLLCSPNNITREFSLPKMLEIIKTASQDFDYVVLDLPAGAGMSVLTCKELSTMNLIVTIPDSATLRDTQKIADSICNQQAKTRLIVNRVSGLKMELCGMSSIDSIIDFVGVQLIGVLPEDELINAPIAYKRKSKASITTTEILTAVSQRIMGEQVPIVLKKI